MGGVGLWLGLVVGLVCAASLLMLRFWRGLWLADKPGAPTGGTPA